MTRLRVLEACGRETPIVDARNPKDAQSQNLNQSAFRQGTGSSTFASNDDESNLEQKRSLRRKRQAKGPFCILIHDRMLAGSWLQ